jgi:hypothetical protein
MTDATWRDIPTGNRMALEMTLDSLGWIGKEHAAIVALCLATASSLDDEYTAAKSSSYLQGLRMLRNSAPDGAPVDELEQLLTR